MFHAFHMASGISTGFAAQQAASSATRSASEAGRAAQKAAAIEDRVDKLTLVCMALWSLLKERTDLTEQDLIDRVRQIDLQDGKEDGKVTRTVMKCAHCGRTMHPRHHKCLYCGALALQETAFDVVG